MMRTSVGSSGKEIQYRLLFFTSLRGGRASYRRGTLYNAPWQAYFTHYLCQKKYERTSTGVYLVGIHRIPYLESRRCLRVRLPDLPSNLPNFLLSAASSVAETNQRLHLDLELPGPPTSDAMALAPGSRRTYDTIERLGLGAIRSLPWRALGYYIVCDNEPVAPTMMQAVQLGCF